MKKLLVLLLFICCTATIHAEDKSWDETEWKHPAWVQALINIFTSHVTLETKQPDCPGNTDYVNPYGTNHPKGGLSD